MYKLEVKTASLKRRSEAEATKAELDGKTAKDDAAVIAEELL